MAQITKVEYYNGTTLIGTKTTAPFDSFTWSGANTPDGTSPVLSAKLYVDNVHVATSTNITISVGSGTSVGLLLDDSPGALYAYSFRLLSSTYAGACIRVRRASDNLETDIGFVNNYVDKTALLDFCGASNGYVTTQYDQTGNGRHWKNTAAANQVTIVSGSAIKETNGFVFLGNPDNSVENLELVNNPAFLTTTVNELIAGVQPNDAKSFILTSSGAAGAYSYVAAPGDTSTGLVGDMGAPTLRINGIDRTPSTRGDVYNLIADGLKKLMVVRNANMSTWNRVEQNYDSSSVYSGVRMAFERVAYPDSLKEAAVESNINAYYTIY